MLYLSRGASFHTVLKSVILKFAAHADARLHKPRFNQLRADKIRGFFQVLARGPKLG